MAGRRSVPQRPRLGLRVESLRSTLRAAQGDPVHGRGGHVDNSLAESFNAALKRELLQGASAFPDQATAYRAVFRWTNRYNTRRRHSAIGQITPNSYENTYAAARSATLTEAA
ncbi:integrase core domain-containing protein [Microbacterium lacticum]